MHELHPLCTLFPRLDDDALNLLAQDIKTHGLREPITLHDGMILDGGNRYAACQIAGIEPTFKEFDGPSIGAFVLSANLHRRHLSVGQQAAIVASVQDWSMAHGHGNSGNFSQVLTVSTCTADRAAISGASVTTQRRADAVAKADPELAAAVGRGDVPLGKAVEQVAPKLAPRKKPKHVEDETAEEAFSDFDPLEELKEAQAEIDRLNAQVKALTTDDLQAELAKQIAARQGIEIRLSQEMAKAANLDRQLRRLGTLLARLRRLTKTDSNSAAVDAVAALVESR